MVEYIVVKIASDSVDAFILALAQIGVILGSFSAGASILLLADYFKRHGNKRKKKFSKEELREFSKEDQAKINKAKDIKGSVKTSHSAKEDIIHYH